MSSCALAVAEGNAAGRLAVTAPTLGSAGTMSAVLHTLKHRLQVPQSALRHGLMAAGAVGLICKTNASVAGAEMGCQAEIGVASAMAAARLAYATGASAQVTENAATIALEHHLGLTCDPVGGFVLIPCIERNAFGAVKAYNAWLIAKNEIADQARGRTSTRILTVVVVVVVVIEVIEDSFDMPARGMTGGNFSYLSVGCGTTISADVRLPNESSIS